ncbi:MAG TPA: acetylxylan esterase [Prevotella sp.]|nr:acetylxylan esterase [Prevotella sp.]
MVKKIVSLFIVMLIGLHSFAQIRGTNIVVMVQPDHTDWNYEAGQTAVFKVSVLKSSTLLSDVKIDYEAGPVEFPTVKKEGVTLKDGTMTWKGSMAVPGFYRLKIIAHVGNKTYEGLCTAGFSPQKVQPAAQCPKDFDAFWKKALEEARKNGLNPTRRLLPERCTQDMNVYEISYVNDQPNSRIYGILSIPTHSGKYPALLRVPGAGVRPYQGDTYTAPGKAIVLEIGIHGIPVTMDQKVYDDLLNGALRSYSYTNLEDPDQNYYKRVVVGAVRGVDYISSLPEWDGKIIGVTGASQGGFLSLAVAALDKRITFLAAVHDAMCDYESELKGVAGGWPHYFLYDKDPTQQKINAVRYYDGDNFARRCHVPAWFSFGYNDETVPPTSSYGVYNIYPGPKTLSVYQQTGHYWYQEQWDEWQAWLFSKLLSTVE